ncbi:MAG: hypothetical protein AB4038_07765 [Prochloraceae cyanobacterium]
MKKKKIWIIIALSVTALTVLISFIIALNNTKNDKEQYQQRLQKKMLMEEIKHEFDRNKDIDG